MVQALPRPFAKRLLLTLAAIGSAGSLWLGWAHSVYAVRNNWELALEMGLAAQSVLVAILLSRATVRPEPDRLPAPIAESLQWLYAPWTRPGMGILLGLLRLSAMLGAATASLGLCFDARYRDFPLTAFAVSAVGFFAMALWRGEIWPRREDQREEAALSLILGGSAVFIAINEGPLNLHAMAWCVLTLLLAAPGIGALRGLRKRPLLVGWTLTA
jgi:hypothetical protein